METGTLRAWLVAALALCTMVYAAVEVPKTIEQPGTQPAEIGNLDVDAVGSDLAAAQAELDDVLSLGGAFEAVDTLKSRLVASMADRTRRIESGDQTVVGVNAYTETAEGQVKAVVKGGESVKTAAKGDEIQIVKAAIAEARNAIADAEIEI